MYAQDIPIIQLNSVSVKSQASCGYCQGSKSDKLWSTSGFRSSNMTPYHYEQLLKNGWRRSGDFFYTPHPNESCCQAYPIRINLQNYKDTYSHGRLLNGIYDLPSRKTYQDAKKLIDEFFQYVLNNLKNNNFGKDKAQPNYIIQKVQGNEKYCTDIIQLMSSNPQFEEFKNDWTELIDKFPSLNGFLTLLDNQDLLITLNPFDIKIEPASYQQETFELYARFSQKIFQKQVSQCSFKNFICQQSLSNSPQNASFLKQGSYHMKYFLEDKLVAVSVIDILPESLSSVYCFYDPKLEDSSFSTFVVGQDIKLMRTLNLQNYYMGYYIANNAQMARKAQYQPCEIFLPNSKQWIEISKQDIQDLDWIGSMDLDNKNDESSFVEFIHSVKIIINGQPYSLMRLKEQYHKQFASILKALHEKLGSALLSELQFIC